MSVRITEILSGIEFQRRNDQGREDGYWNTDIHVFPPGSAWFMPWIYDPSGKTPHSMIASPEAANSNHLSAHYWRDWSKRRPPICVVCPNGELWEIDRPASNGVGWKVTGELSSLTCVPSIVVTGYHGYLQGGVFSPDIEGRGPNGLSRPYTPRQQDR